MTEKNTLTILGVLTSAYPNARITPETVRVYVLTLQDIPPDVLEHACLHHITNSTFFPTVAELRDASYRLMLGLHRVPTSAEAWEQINTQRTQCLYYFHFNVQSEKPTFSHPFVEQVLRAFGCRAIIDSQNESLTRASFCKTYDTLLDRAFTDIKSLPAVRAFTSDTESRQVQLKPEWGQPTSGYALRKSEERTLDHALHARPEPTTRQDLLPE